jgi:hypothetical protein
MTDVGRNPFCPSRRDDRCWKESVLPVPEE